MVETERSCWPWVDLHPFEIIDTPTKHAACQRSSPRRAEITLIASVMRRAGRISSTTSQRRMVPSLTDTTASMTMASGPGTMTIRRRRSQGAPGAKLRTSTLGARSIRCRRTLPPSGGGHFGGQHRLRLRSPRSSQPAKGASQGRTVVGPPASERFGKERAPNRVRGEGSRLHPVSEHEIAFGPLNAVGT